ncbi:MAG: MFS transporter [Candidatus Aminicenantes bacterium]|nr:MFS transporter [Candidatus Aminicenantes bacterium]
MTKEEKSWILYDVGNSAFVLIVVTTIMPIFFKEIASKGIPDAVSTANWGFANSLASLILAVLAPILGAIADFQDLKKKFFIFFLCLGIAFTVLLTAAGPGAWLSCLIIFIISRVGWAGANLFYDSFIVDVTEKKRMDIISTRGYAYGYIGAAVPFLLVIFIMLFWEKAENAAAIAPLPAKIAFLIAAAWWSVFSIPMLRNVKHKHFAPKTQNPVKDGFLKLLDTFKEIRKYKQVFLFLLAYFFYIDGVDTIISMATAYGMDIGLKPAMLILAILMIQVVAFPFALLFGSLANKYSAKPMILTGIGVYMFITLLAFFLPSFSNLTVRTVLFWVIAFLVATSMGGIQALSRSYFGKLVPAERSAEFFGFYNIFGKFAAISGPFIMGVITRLTGHSRFGVLSILILFISGAVILKSLPRQHGPAARGTYEGQAKNNF